MSSNPYGKKKLTGEQSEGLKEDVLYAALDVILDPIRPRGGDQYDIVEGTYQGEVFGTNALFKLTYLLGNARIRGYIGKFKLHLDKVGDLITFYNESDTPVAGFHWSDALGIYTWVEKEVARAKKE